MSEPQFFATPGYGQAQLTNLHYSQAVRTGDRVEISGQGGWDDDFAVPEALEDEIDRACDNVERTLDPDGSISEATTGAMAEQFRRRMGDRAPIWTEVGVAALGLPAMRVEIRVTAVTGHDR